MSNSVILETNAARMLGYKVNEHLPYMVIKESEFNYSEHEALKSLLTKNVPLEQYEQNGWARFGLSAQELTGSVVSKLLLTDTSLKVHVPIFVQGEWTVLVVSRGVEDGRGVVWIYPMGCTATASRRRS